MDGHRKNLHDLRLVSGQHHLRMEGFTGQHLVVLPAGVRQAAARDPLLRGLHVTDAGFFPRAVGHYVERPAGAPSHLVLLCTGGEGAVSFRGGETRVVRAGTLAWLPARQAHVYRSDLKQPWTITWVHFNGDEVEGWREYLGFPPGGGVRSSEAMTQPVRRLQEIYQVIEAGYPRANLLRAATLLRAFFVEFAPWSAGSERGGTAAERVAGTVEWMRERLDRRLRLAELAAAAALSVPYYAELFSRQFGYGPIDFLIRLRVQRACQLLDTTPLSVKEIARRVGFEDAFYFSRKFRAIMGKSPRSYRSWPKG
jgi:Transcriptional regulator containing an amidase domain and an AraC-type DNA-binding HTH domain